MPEEEVGVLKATFLVDYSQANAAFQDIFDQAQDLVGYFQQSPLTIQATGGVVQRPPEPLQAEMRTPSVTQPSSPIAQPTPSVIVESPVESNLSRDILSHIREMESRLGITSEQSMQYVTGLHAVRDPETGRIVPKTRLREREQELMERVTPTRLPEMQGLPAQPPVATTSEVPASTGGFVRGESIGEMTGGITIQGDVNIPAGGIVIQSQISSPDQQTLLSEIRAIIADVISQQLPQSERVRDVIARTRAAQPHGTGMGSEL